MFRSEEINLILTKWQESKEINILKSGVMTIAFKL
jgi:hypothetical protein